MPEVIYIASTSRAGSTLLDLILGAGPQSFSVGEMRQLQGYANKSYEMCNFSIREYPLICTCGRNFEECEVWETIQKNSGLNFKITPFKTQAPVYWRRIIQLVYLSFGITGINLLSRIFTQINKEIKIAINCYNIYETISKLYGIRQIVDSSKSIYHYILLRSLYPDKIKLIVLYRDGRAVAKSMVRGKRAIYWKKQSQSAFSQAARNWLKTNRAIKLFSKNVPDNQKIEIRYEDLCTFPEVTLSKIKRQLGVDIPLDINAALRDKTLRHNIGGSPSRFEPNTKIHLDERWKKEISPEELAQFEKIAGKFNKMLGYK